ncbi:hypothetical protein MNBD_GAMMA04-25 [hydrothermal vent metagenome]|uniref:WbqC-like protein family protein n=1 Tax=hydrothermal vent metagenome TaxID=652676 RepID=A0A3B0W3R9_9ZZZZ
MKCAIMQPTYLPWSGYFNLIQSVDKFVFLDDVQFEKQSWQSRNRLAQNAQEMLLSIPIKKHSLSSKINQITVNQQQSWQKKHVKSLRQAYAKSPYIEDVLSALESIIIGLKDEEPKDRLIDYTIPIIKTLASLLGIKVEWYYSSDIFTKGKRSDKLIEICQFLNCNQYCSPIGSRGYIEEDGAFNSAGIDLVYQCFQPAPYVQATNTVFIPHLSVIDVIANVGLDEARDYIQKGTFERFLKSR